MVREEHVHPHGVQQHDRADAQCPDDEAPLDCMCTHPSIEREKAREGRRQGDGGGREREGLGKGSKKTGGI